MHPIPLASTCALASKVRGIPVTRSVEPKPPQSAIQAIGRRIASARPICKLLVVHKLQAMEIGPADTSSCLPASALVQASYQSQSGKTST